MDSRQSYKSKKEKGRRGGDAVAGATGAAAVVIMRLLLHCVYACVRTQRVCVCVCVSSPSSLQTGGEDIPL